MWVLHWFGWYSLCCATCWSLWWTFDWTPGNSIHHRVGQLCKICKCNNYWLNNAWVIQIIICTINNWMIIDIIMIIIRKTVVRSYLLPSSRTIGARYNFIKCNPSDFWLQITTMGGLSPIHMVGAREIGKDKSQGDPSLYYPHYTFNVWEIWRGSIRGLLITDNTRTPSVRVTTPPLIAAYSLLNELVQTGSWHISTETEYIVRRHLARVLYEKIYLTIVESLKDNPSNYRPTSLTCLCCRLMEHIAVSNFMRHLPQTSLLRNTTCWVLSCASQ